MRLRSARDAIHHVNATSRYNASNPKPIYRNGAGPLVGWTFQTGAVEANTYGWVLTTGAISATWLHGRAEAATEARINANHPRSTR